MNRGFLMTAPYITMHVYPKRVVTKTGTGLGLDWAADSFPAWFETL